MTPYEIMLSESQERMLIVAKRGREDEVLRIFHKWDLDAAVIGRVTDDGRVRILDGGKEVANLPVTPLTDGAPVYDRPTRRPAEQDALQAFDPLSVPPGRDHGEALLALLARPDHRAARSGSSGSTTTPCGSARSCGPVRRTRRWCGSSGPRRASPWRSTATRGSCTSTRSRARGWRWPSARGTSPASGGEPLGLTDCLNFGNPERPEIMWQFAEATRGIAAACRELGRPGGEREREPLQRDRGQGDPADADRRPWWGCSPT